MCFQCSKNMTFTERRDADSLFEDETFVDDRQQADYAENEAAYTEYVNGFLK